MSLAAHFTRELKISGLYYNSTNLASAIVEIGKLLDSRELSTDDVVKCAALMEKLIKVEPLTPLTGDEDEWIAVDSEWDMNLRCKRVFREKETGLAYDIHAKLFIESIGGKKRVFNDSNSRVIISFPYTPKTEYIEITDNK